MLTLNFILLVITYWSLVGLNLLVLTMLVVKAQNRTNSCNRSYISTVGKVFLYIANLPFALLITAVYMPYWFMTKVVVTQGRY